MPFNALVSSSSVQCGNALSSWFLSGGQTSTQPPSGRGWFQPDMSSESVSPEGRGCLSVLLGCRESARCWSAYRKLRSSCSLDKDQCRVLASRSSCLLLWGELKSSPLANCTCPVGGKRCLKVQALLQNNPCIHAEQDSLAPPLPKAIHQNMGNGTTFTRHSRSSLK